MLSGFRRRRIERIQSYLRESLNTMASKLGEMQAQLLRLDVLGDRLAKLAGLKPQEFIFEPRPPAVALYRTPAARALAASS